VRSRSQAECRPLHSATVRSIGFWRRASQVLCLLCLDALAQSSRDLALFLQPIAPGGVRQITTQHYRDDQLTSQVDALFGDQPFEFAAAVAVTGLFGAAWFGRTGFDVETRLPGFDRPKLRRRCYEIAFGATLMQFLIGTLVYFTLPAQGVSFFMTGVVLLGVVFAVVALSMMWGEVVAPAARIGRRFAPIVIVLSATVTCMAMGRHLYREESLAAHRELMAESTEDFRREVQAAAWRKEQGVSLVKVSRGERIFQICAGCHALDREKGAPTAREIQRIYAGNPAGIVTWSKSPGRKRTKFAPMPPPSHMPEADLRAAAEYLLQFGRTKPAEPDTPEE